MTTPKKKMPFGLFLALMLLPGMVAAGLIYWVIAATIGQVNANNDALAERMNPGHHQQAR